MSDMTSGAEAGNAMGEVEAAEAVEGGSPVRLSVVIPCYNDADVLGEQLEALTRQSWDHPWEVVIADNGSTDASMSVAEGYRDRLPLLRIIDASDRSGPAHARNVGAREARGDLLVFVDADDVVAPGWLAALGNALEDVSFVASRHDFTELNDPMIQRTRRNKQDEGLQPYKHPPFYPHASGSGLGVRREIHEAMGGFDEDLPNLQDTDYCWRVQLAGTELHFVGDAVVHYRFRDSLRGIYVQGMNYGEHNVLLYKRYRSKGMPKANWKRGVRAWIDLVLSAPDLLEEEKRLRWVRQLGWRVGRVKGCIKHRVFAP
jgi:glycosyltransferase involved in cell wall biosynthesis